MPRTPYSCSGARILPSFNYCTAVSPGVGISDSFVAHTIFVDNFCIFGMFRPEVRSSFLNHYRHPNTSPRERVVLCGLPIRLAVHFLGDSLFKDRGTSQRTGNLMMLSSLIFILSYASPFIREASSSASQSTRLAHTHGHVSFRTSETVPADTRQVRRTRPDERLAL